MGTEILKRNASRQVRLERDGGDARVVKRFESDRLLAVFRDRLRARNEFELLQHLERAGVRVPRALELRRAGGGWEVVLAWIPDAVGLDELLAGRAELDGRASPEQLARRVGALLAGLHAAAVEHPDLHAGNLLVDRSGQVWALDFHAARRRRHLTAEQALESVAVLASGTREFLGRRLRARVLVAWLAHLPAALREELRGAYPDTFTLGRELELAARRHRREVVFARRKRWTRVSGEARVIPDAALVGHARRDLPTDLPAALLAARSERIELPGANEARGTIALLRSGLRWERLEAELHAAARLVEHRIPCARPLCAIRAPRALTAFEVPLGTRPAGAASSWSPATWRSLGELVGRLDDRGLSIAEGAAELSLEDQDSVLLTRVERLDEADFDARPDPTSWLGRPSLAGADGEQREAFLEGWRSGWGEAS